MKRKPRHPQESVFAGGMARHIIWVSILLTIITLGGYIYGYTSRGMDPFSSTLSLETFDRERLVALVGEETVAATEAGGLLAEGDAAEGETAVTPVNWDSLTLEQRQAIIHEGELGGRHGESSEGLIGAAEKLPRTLAFTILALGQIFHVTAIHAGDKTSFFSVFFRHNMPLFYAIVSTFVLQLAVIYLPFMQPIFETSALSGQELLLAIGVSSLILIAVEFEKLISRMTNRRSTPVQSPA